MAFDTIPNVARDWNKERGKRTTPELSELTLAEWHMKMRLHNRLRGPVTWKKEEWVQCMQNRHLRCPRCLAGVHPLLAKWVASMAGKEEREKEERERGVTTGSLARGPH